MPTSALELVQPIVNIVWMRAQEVGRPLRILVSSSTAFSPGELRSIPLR